MTPILFVGSTELDTILFVRGADCSVVLRPGIPDLDPDYSTNGDYFFAKLMAYEKLQDYLINVLYPSSERNASGKTLPL